MGQHGEPDPQTEPVDGGDQRLGEGGQRLDEAGEGGAARVRRGGPSALAIDDGAAEGGHLEQVLAGREGAAGAGQDDDRHGGVGGRVVERPGGGPVERLVEGIKGLRAVEGDGPDQTVADLRARPPSWHPVASALMVEFNIRLVHETVAAVAPDRECLVGKDFRLTFADVTDRSRRLAAYLRGRGLGCHTERSELAGHESGQDQVALYLHNGHEYIEGMLGAFKSRTAPFNVNYRYVAEELRYLFNDAKAQAVIYHAEFAPSLAAVLPALPAIAVLLQVADDSGNALLPAAVDLRGGAGLGVAR